MSNTLASLAEQALLIYLGVKSALAFLRRLDDYIHASRAVLRTEPHGSQAKT
jgi:hypothetical protein